MWIKKVRVQNFRPILDATLECDNLTALVGANGAGKSTFLHAIELFYAVTPRVVPDDFYNLNIDLPIEVTVSYCDLDDDEKIRFKNYLQDEDLSVVRLIYLTKNSYHGVKLQHPDFRRLRDAANAAELRRVYNELKAARYDLPSYTNKDAAQDSIEKWELDHKDQCVRERDDGQFFGFKEVGQGYLGRDTRFVFIPAVRDASEDAAEGRGSAITELMDLLVRRTLFEKEEIKQFKQEMQQRYVELLDPAKIPELELLSEQLSGTLRTYVASSSVSITWDVAHEIEIPVPDADVRLVEDGFPTDVSRSGHGLQRAFILTILQHLSAQQIMDSNQQERPAEGVAVKPEPPDLILGIEEPELYQHPTRQRHFSSVLLKLAGNAIPGVARRVQLIYATHSPLLVGLDRFDQVRMIRKVQLDDHRPKVTQVVHRTLDQVAQTISKANGDGKIFTGETLKPRLVTLMNPSLSEAFFADVVVLVEGENDRATLEAAARYMTYDFNGMGIAVIPCNGKPNIFNAAAIFLSFGIPLYVVWDGDSHLGKTEGKCKECGHNLDSKADPKENRRLEKLLGLKEEDWPNHVLANSACFKQKLETTIRDEIGEELFNNLLDASRTKYGITRRKDAIKNPTVLAEVLGEAKAKGQSSQTLETIVTAIVTLKGEADVVIEAAPYKENALQPANPKE